MPNLVARDETASIKVRQTRNAHGLERPRDLLPVKKEALKDLVLAEHLFHPDWESVHDWEKEYLLHHRVMLQVAILN